MVRLLALLLTVLAGFAAFACERAWREQLSALLGSGGEADAVALAVFLGGLSIGCALFGRATRRALGRARRRARLFFLYARVEAALGAFALAFPILFSVAEPLSLRGALDPGALGFALDVALAALLIGPPAILTGGALPVLTLALSGNSADAARAAARVFGAYALGVCAGVLAAACWLLPLLGPDGVSWAMGGLHLAAAAAFAGLGRGAGDVAPESGAPRVAQQRPRNAAWSGGAALAGFATATLLVAFVRIGSLALGATQSAAAMLVAVFALCVALGSFAVSALPRIPRGLVAGSQWALVGLLFFVYLWAPDAGYWTHWIRVRLGGLEAAFFPYHLAVFAAALGVLAIPIGLAGALLPLLLHRLWRDRCDLGAVAGRLYAWCALGALMGVLMGGYGLLVRFDLHELFRIAMACFAIAATALSLLAFDRTSRAIAALVLLLTLAALARLPAWPTDRWAPGTFRTRRPIATTFLGAEAFFERRGASEVVFYEDDPTSSVAVGVPRRQPEDIALYVDGRSEGSLAADHTAMLLGALLPALLAERGERALAIGLGLGVGARELAALEGMRKVAVIEASRAVIAAQPLFASDAVGAASRRKIEIVRGDAHRALSRSDERYDVISSAPSHPWVADVDRLYTREFLEVARSRLAPGGVYGQRLHVHETDREIIDLVLRGFASVFPRVSVWYTDGSDLLVLGMDRAERELDVRALEARFERPDFSAAFGRVQIDRFPQLLAHELIPLGTIHAEPLDGPIHTRRRPILAGLAARSFFFGSRSARVGPFSSTRHQAASMRNSLLRRYAGGAEVLPEAIFEVATHEICRFQRARDCATFVARWSVEHPDSDLWRATLSSLRKTAHPMDPHLAAYRLERLRALHRGGSMAEGDAVPAHVEALRVTGLFLNHYNHVVPFDRRAVEEVWNRCGDAACEAEREEVAPLLWGFDDGASR